MPSLRESEPRFQAIVADLVQSVREAMAMGSPCPKIGAMPAYDVMDSAYIPLSKRAPAELRRRADELLRMAATATTQHTKTSLETLAARFKALADRREAEDAQR